MAGITYSMDMSLSKLWERVKDREAWRPATVGSKRVRHDSVTERTHTQENTLMRGLNDVFLLHLL